jgi:hypothetical protein
VYSKNKILAPVMQDITHSNTTKGTYQISLIFLRWFSSYEVLYEKVQMLLADSKSA